MFLLSNNRDQTIAISGVSFLGMHAKRSKMEWIVLFFLFDHIALAKLLLVETDEEQLNR